MLFKKRKLDYITGHECSKGIESLSFIYIWDTNLTISQILLILTIMNYNIIWNRWFKKEDVKNILV